MLGRLALYGEPEVSPDRSQASSAEELVIAYHERTKHHYHRFAASVGYVTESAVKRYIDTQWEREKS